jgi:hypothetical protein
LFALFAMGCVIWGWRHFRAPSIAPWAEKVFGFESDARLAAASVDRFCAESAELATEPLLQPSPRTKDAATFFAPLVGWQGTTETIIKRKLTLPQAVVDRISQAKGDDWPEQLAPIARDLDFSWMREARQFDYWTISTVGIGRTVDWPSLWDSPIPRVHEIYQWSKLRFARAIAEREMGDAVVEVRNLARLCGTTPYLLGPAIRNRLAELEAKATEAARRRNVPIDGWQTIRPERLARLHPVLMASVGFLTPKVPSDVRKRALDCMSWNKCGPITEAVRQYALAGLGRTVEADELVAAAEGAGCSDIALLRREQEAPPPSEGEASFRMQAVEDSEGSGKGVLWNYSQAGPDAGVLAADAAGLQDLPAPKRSGENPP